MSSSSTPSAMSISVAVALLLQGAMASTAIAQNGVFQIEIVADDMCCNGCAQKIAAQLYAAPGVTAVEADLPTRVITVKAKPSPKLTLQKLWQAVEQGQGAPSQLTTTEATYKLKRSEQLDPQQRLSEGHYAVVLQTLKEPGQPKRITDAVSKIRGVKGVRVVAESRTVLVETSDNLPLSPWVLAMTVQVAGSEPLSVSGSYGTLSIERVSDDLASNAVRQAQPQLPGEIR